MISELAFSQSLIPYRKGNKWGYSNEKGEIIIKPKYKEVGIFNEKITWVKKGNKFGYINKKGVLVTKIEFIKAGTFGDRQAFVKTKEESYCINSEGKKTQCFSMCGGSHFTFLEYQTYRKGNKIGVFKYIFTDGVIIDTLPAIWDEIKINSYYAAVKQDNKWGVINFEGELVTELIYDSIELKSEYGRHQFFKVKYQDRYGFLNEKGEELIPPKYYKADFFGYGIAKVWLTDKLYFYIDSKGKEFYEP